MRAGTALPAGFHHLKWQHFLALAGILLATLACAIVMPAQPSPQTVAATAGFSSTVKAVPSAVAVPLYQRVNLTSADSQERGQPFDYKVTARTPQLTGADDPPAAAFNEEMTGIVRQAVTEFKANLVAMPSTPRNAASSFDVSYRLLSPPGAILSIKFEMTGYVSGAAHPYDISRAINFDLDRGRDLALAELFLPGSDYLGLISGYCIAELESRDIAFEESNVGAAATLDNYRNWNITADGMLITFDEYQVAAYAAGPQLVLIPYSTLAPLIEKPGPLDPYSLGGQ